MNKSNPTLVLKSIDYSIGNWYSDGIYIGIFENKYLIFFNTITSAFHSNSIHKYMLDVKNDYKFKLCPTRKEINFVKNTLLNINRESETAYFKDVFIQDKPNMLYKRVAENRYLYRMILNRIYE